jgi:hypothetical protein
LHGLNVNPSFVTTAYGATFNSLKLEIEGAMARDPQPKTGSQGKQTRKPEARDNANKRGFHA